MAGQETGGYDGSGFRFDDPEVAPERKTAELREQSADDTGSLDDRLRSGEIKWLGAYITNNPELRRASSAVLADLRERYGAEQVLLSSAFDKETGTAVVISGQMGIYVTTAAYEAVESAQ